MWPTRASRKRLLPKPWTISTRRTRVGLVESIRRAEMVHADQRRETCHRRGVAGGTVTETWVPVDRVGLYVPGGLAVYPSSVVMNVVPAQVAGVGSIAVCSPPQKEFGGLPHPTILAACALLGVDEVYAVGGAQAIAMFAYGDESLGIEPVDMITGPGNVYVAAAKRLLAGVVGIDAEAGPTEIAVLADAGADPVHVAADLISQAEHDPMAAAVLVTDSPALAEAVDVELERQVALTKHVDRVRAALTGAVGHGPGRRSGGRAGRGRRLRGRAPRGHHRGRPGAGRAGAQRRLRLRRPVLAGVARRLLRRLEPRAADRLHRAARVGVVGAVVPQGHAPGRVRRGGADRGGSATSSRCRRPRTCPRTVPRLSARLRANQ